LKKKVLIPIILFVVSFITFIVALSLAFQEQTYLDITEENRQIIYNALNSNYLDNIGKINKVSAGSGFHSGELCLYYENGDKEILYPVNVANFDDISEFIKENGYDYDNILMLMVCISLIVMFSIFIYTVYCIFKFIRKIIGKYY